MNDRRKIIVTGGMGFIGSHLVKRLVEEEASVTVIEKDPDMRRNIIPDAFLSKINLIKADITDENKMNEVVRGVDVIFDLAGRSGAVDSWNDPFADLEVNCKGHLTLLEACRKYNPEAKYIFPGTRLEFGPPQYLPVDEKHPFNPQSIHAIHKLTVEKYCSAYYHRYGLRTIVLRIANPYGPFPPQVQRTYNIVNNFIWAIMHGEKVSVFGDGSQIRDYIYIDDLVDLMLQFANQDKYGGEVFNVGTGKPTRLIDMVKTIIKVLGKGEYQCVPWPKSYAEVETGDYYSDIKKVQGLIGWKPRMDLEPGISKTIEFYRKIKVL